MVNTNRENTCAQMCGMTIEQWRAAKQTASNARTRGRKSRAPRIADDPAFPCPDQMGLFPEPPQDGAR
jgi:hypothetical protein